MKAEMSCLHHLFHEQAKRTPEVVALVDGHKTMSYRELDHVTDQLAGFLQAKDVTFDESVGIFMETCMEYLVAYLAILKAGGAYIPLALAYPDTLLEKVIDEAEPKAVVTKQQYSNRFNAEYEGKALFLDNDDDWKSYEYDREAVRSQSLNHLAFIAFTSGTTGEPKGVLIPHRAVVHSYWNRYKQSAYAPGDKVACNIFFVWEILRPLLKGATCFIIPDHVIYDPKPLLDFLAEHKITEVLFTPSLLETVFNSVDGEQIRSRLSSLKVIWLNGEVVRRNLKNRVLKILPEQVRLLNTYSICECHDVADVDLRTAGDLASGNCCVGQPIEAVELRLVDESMQPVPRGEAGELYVGGPCLARGYLNKPALTAERFAVIDGKRFYKTGDLAEIHADGNLEIKGRCDYMVKIRGYSIHLGAVETTLLDHAGVKSCAVLAEGEEGSDKRLVAYVVRDETAEWKVDKETGTSVDLRNLLKSHLAHYMIPAAFVELDKIPINPITGKLNHKKLPSPPPKYESNLQDLELAKEASVQEMEAVMTVLWERILFLEKGTILPESDFFDFGGHSLLAAELATAIERVFDIPVTVQAIYQYPTIKALLRNMLSETAENLPHVSISNDAALDPGILPGTETKPLSLDNASTILITGTTGFLGAFLLDELLRSTEDHVSIYCMVRAKEGGQKNILNRIIDNLTYYGLDHPAAIERIIPVNGDLTIEYFGWPREQFVEMAAKIDFIFHCASLVNYVFSYEQIKPTTVNGTHEIIRLASTLVTKPIHYISTNGIFPGEEHAVYFENDAIDAFADKLDNGYEQAKWVAEKMAWKAVSRKLPICLYRPGNIGHHRRTGAANPNDFQTMIINACTKVNCAPKADGWVFEITPVDFLAETIATFAREPAHYGKVYNIVQNGPVPARAVFDLLLDRGYIAELVSVEEWKSRLIRKGQEEDDYLLDVLAQSMDAFESYLNSHSRYDCSGFESALATHTLPWPTVDADYFMKIVQSVDG